MLRFFKRIIKKIYNLFKSFISMRWLAYIIGFFMPIKRNRIIITTDNGDKYGDNCKYIYEELLKLNKDLDIFFVLNDKSKLSQIPGKCKSVKYDSFQFVIKHLTSSVWIDNSRKKILFKKKKTLYIQTWHGGGMYKRSEAAVADKLPKQYIKIAKKDSKLADIFISESRVKTLCFFDDFWYDNYVLEVGNPRIDTIFDSLKNEELKKNVNSKIRSYFKIDRNVKIILYAPTFRKNGEISSYITDYDKIIKTCEEKFGGKFVILLRLHGNVLNKCSQINFSASVINASYYDDTQELLIATDILITDYSSINYDFSFMKKPSFRYCTDIADYLDDRGFYYDIDSYPYPVGRNMNELCELIRSFNLSDFNEKVANFHLKEKDVSDGHASKICAELIAEYINTFDKNALVKKFDLIKK